MATLNQGTKREIVKNLVTKYGDDFLTPQKCLEIYENLGKEKVFIQSQLDIENYDCAIGKSVQEGEALISKFHTLATHSNEVITEIETDLDDIDEYRKELQIHFDKVHDLQTTLQYLKVLQKIEFLHVELGTEFEKRDDERAITIFANLCEISRNLINFSGTFLRSHLKEILFHWHDILKGKLSKDFEEVLKIIKWPFVNTNFSLQSPSNNSIQRLQIVSEYLLQIELPTESSDPFVTSGLMSDFLPLCLPVSLLVKPLRKRFLYHFYGARQTNRNDKPEWYFTQILTWIRDHKDFVGKWIQQVVDKLGLHHIDAELELARGLVQLAVEKLQADLPSVQYDDFTFSHSIDEALGFDKELRDTYQYPAHQPGVLVVLTQAQIFVKWITMEKKFATEKMDNILSASATEPFEALASDIEDLKITTCADAFITLLQTIKDRYENLPQPGHRMQFLELQLELLDDFRVRLIQLVNAEQGDVIESKIPMIANTLYYIENVLMDWGNMLHYLNLYYYKSQINKSKSSPSVLNELDVSVSECEMETVFTETLSLYSHMREDLLCTLAESVLAEAKSRSKLYRRERWNAMNVNKDFKSLSLTPTACPMFEVIGKRLHQLQKALASKLFAIAWRSTARQLDTFLFEDLVLDNMFNGSGALQLKYDVFRNLLPLFSQFSEKPDCYFVQLIESINLLNISKGSALLLRETILALEGATGVEDTRGRALKEIGVSNFTPKMAVTILNRRTDITVNRLNID